MITRFKLSKLGDVIYINYDEYTMMSSYLGHHLRINYQIQHFTNPLKAGTRIPRIQPVQQRKTGFAIDRKDLPVYILGTLISFERNERTTSGR